MVGRPTRLNIAAMGPGCCNEAAAGRAQLQNCSAETTVVRLVRAAAAAAATAPEWAALLSESCFAAAAEVGLLLYDSLGCLCHFSHGSRNVMPTEKNSS